MFSQYSSRFFASLLAGLKNAHGPERNVCSSYGPKEVPAGERGSDQSELHNYHLYMTSLFSIHKLTNHSSLRSYFLASSLCRPYSPASPPRPERTPPRRSRSFSRIPCTRRRWLRCGLIKDPAINHFLTFSITNTSTSTSTSTFALTRTASLTPERRPTPS